MWVGYFYSSESESHKIFPNAQIQIYDTLRLGWYSWYSHYTCTADITRLIQDLIWKNGKQSWCKATCVRITRKCSRTTDYTPRIVFGSPVTRLKKDSDQTGPEPQKTSNTKDWKKLRTAVWSMVNHQFKLLKTTENQLKSLLTSLSRVGYSNLENRLWNQTCAMI